MSARTGTLADADVLPLALEWLSAHPDVLAAFGSPECVSGVREAPWPHLQVTAGQGGLPPDFEKQVAYPEVEIAVWGHPDGSTGAEECRRLLFTAVGALLQVRTAPYVFGRPVVTYARPSGDLVAQNLANGQTKWASGVAFRVRPPQLAGDAR